MIMSTRVPPPSTKHRKEMRPETSMGMRSRRGEKGGEGKGKWKGRKPQERNTPGKGRESPSGSNYQGRTYDPDSRSGKKGGRREHRPRGTNRLQKGAKTQNPQREIHSRNNTPGNARNRQTSGTPPYKTAPRKIFPFFRKTNVRGGGLS